MMGAMGAQNMYSNLAVINICLQLHLAGFLQPSKMNILNEKKKLFSLFNKF